MQTLLETKPPQGIRQKFTDNLAAQAILDFATKFHNTFGILPSLRCKNLAADLENLCLELGGISTLEQANKIRKKFSPLFQEKYGFKEGSITRLDVVSIHVAIEILQETIFPAYEHCEKGFTEKLKAGCKRLHYDYGSFISTSEGTPFLEASLSTERTLNGYLLECFVRPTSERLHTLYSKNSKNLDHPEGIVFMISELTEGGVLLIRDLQRSKIKSNKQPLGPYGLLEQLFLLFISGTDCKTVVFPTTNAIFEYWKTIDLEHGTEYTKKLVGDIHKTELRIYDELGCKYGVRTSKLPKTEFALRIGQKAEGWTVALR